MHLKKQEKVSKAEHLKREGKVHSIGLRAMEASQSEMTRVGVPLPGTEQSYTPRIGETGGVAQHSPLHDSAALRFDASLKGAASGSLKAVKVSPHGSLPNTAPALVCS